MFTEPGSGPIPNREVLNFAKVRRNGGAAHNISYVNWLVTVNIGRYVRCAPLYSRYAFTDRKAGQ